LFDNFVDMDLYAQIILLIVGRALLRPFIINNYYPVNMIWHDNKLVQQIVYNRVEQSPTPSTDDIPFTHIYILYHLYHN